MRTAYPEKTRLDALKKLWRRAFGEEEFMESFFSAAFSPDRCRVGLEGEALAAMLYWLDGQCQGEPYAYLYAVATDPAFRGRGLCRRLMKDTLSLLKSRGYAGAVLYPADEGLRAMYAKMGFRDGGREGGFSCAAQGKTELREITAEEYGALRRSFLPQDGLIQAGENLALLEKTARLYAGDGFLLSAFCNEKTLTAPEFFGREAAAPGILTALGCQTGTFHQGRNAMFHPLKENAPAPGYVGLVFD